MNIFKLISIKTFFIVALVSLIPIQSCTSAQEKETLSSDNKSLLIADSILYNVIDLYAVSDHSLLAETHPVNPGHQVSYLAEGSVQKKEQEVSFLWPYSGIISGTISLYETTNDKKYLTLLQEQLLPGLDSYWDTTREPYSYQSYPMFAGHSDRFYDDNVWIALDFCTLYELTQDKQYLDRAEELYKFIYSGWNDELGGGIFWCEQKRQSKNTCSNAPGAVLGMRLFEATNDESYLEKAIETYAWTKDNLLDKEDGVYWDNVSLSGRVDKTKYTYNSGQMIEAGVLLYNHTNNDEYLTDAQKTALGTHKFFTKEVETVDGEKLFYPNSPWFNVILFRGLKALYLVDNNAEYINTMKENAYYAWNHTRDSNGLLGHKWNERNEKEYKWLLDNNSMIELFSQFASLK